MYCEKIPGIDPENWPTSIAHAVFCHGTKLVSRYRKQHEFRIMIQMAEVIRCRASTARVEEIYCDSQPCAGYRVGGSHGSALQVAETDSKVTHCPGSNLKLGSGIAPVADYLAAKVNVALGADGAASNNRQDGWEQLRLAGLLA